VKVEAENSASRVRGSCLCGKVEYEILGPVGPVSHCHCSQCRKAHGAGFGSYAAVEHSHFRWLGGESLVTGYRSSPDVFRTFCSKCGSTLQFVPEDRELFSLAVATLDDDAPLEVAAEVWTSERVAWADPAGAPEHHPENPPVRQAST